MELDGAAEKRGVEEMRRVNAEGGTLWGEITGRMKAASAHAAAQSGTRPGLSITAAQSGQEPGFCFFFSGVYSDCDTAILE